MPLERLRGIVTMKEQLDRQSMMITMDGSTTAGKRIVAERLADRYGLTIVNTGITIRTLALLAIEEGIVQTDESNVTTTPVDFGEQIAGLFDAVEKDFRLEPPMEGSHNARYMYGEREMRGELLTYPKPKALDNLSSMIAASPVVREKLYAYWRTHIPALGGTVVVGRKTGVDLFPDARIKLYLYASPEAAALYRVIHDPKASKQAESEERYIRERDASDAQYGLLDRPKGGMIIDTSRYIKTVRGLSDLEEKIAETIDSTYTIR